MRKLFKWIFRLILLLVVLLVALIIFKDSIIKAIAERQIRAETGMQVKIGKFQVGIISPVITIEKFKLYNTAEFGGSPFIDIPELHVEYDPVALGSRKLHITLMRFNLAELNVVRNEAGKTNVFAVMNRLESHNAAKEEKKKKRELAFEFTGIDTLNLTLGKARFMDMKSSVNNREINLGLKNEVLKNVKSEGDLYGILMLVMLRNGATFVTSPDQAAQDLLNSAARIGEKNAKKPLDLLPTKPNRK